jgi:hypothetical protein
MKVGDLVRCHPRWSGDGTPAGVIVEMIDTDHSVPPVCKVFWSSGDIDKEWTDELEVICEI